MNSTFVMKTERDFEATTPTVILLETNSLLKEHAVYTVVNIC